MVHRSSNRTLPILQSIHYRHGGLENIRHGRFFPTKCNSPALTQTDRIIIVATNLTNARKDPPLPSPFHDVTNDTMDSINKLTHIFDKLATPLETTQVQTPGTKDVAPLRVIPPPTGATPLPRVATPPTVQPAIISQ
jgi:hypothetical protein